MIEPRDVQVHFTIDPSDAVPVKITQDGNEVQMTKSQALEVARQIVERVSHSDAQPKARPS